MAQFAIAFDLDTVSMRRNGLTDTDITNVYQKEIPAALGMCGFSVHIQGSVYHTEDINSNPLTSLVRLQTTLRQFAPNFCRYVRNVHVFQMEMWSDVTELIQAPLE